MQLTLFLMFQFSIVSNTMAQHYYFPKAIANVQPIIQKKETIENRTRRVAFVHHPLLMRLSSKIPNLQNRATMVYTLINAYRLLENVKIVDVKPATAEELCKFHSNLYVDFLQRLSTDYNSVCGEDKDSVEKLFSEECECYGIGYDCPIVEHLATLVALVAGSSICGAKELCKRSTDVVINWYGGWHHAQRDAAEGFCYVNDIVLAIEEMRNKFNRILYIDLDVHHGNGVENAFSFSRKVFTLSFHKYESGFYPGTGSLNDVGIGRGKYYTANVPLKECISDKTYCYVFDRITTAIFDAYQPEAIVVQCGADSLTGDKLGGFNLTLSSYGFCLRRIMNWKRPTLVLGGGGYNPSNVARCWTLLTSIITERRVRDDIPANEYFLDFGPDFTLSISPSNRKDLNTNEEIQHIMNKIINGVRTNVTSE